jgi:O-antigen ligase
LIRRQGEAAPASVVRLVASVLCLAAVAWGVWSYPLPAWPLAVALLAYVIALWRWPALYLVIIPATLPAFDLGIWTGWMMVGESDLFILVTIAILLQHEPPRAVDPCTGLRGKPVLVLLIVVFGISTVIGLMLPGIGGGVSSNPYLRPDNALRLAKPFAETLALLPFMRRRHRVHGDLAAWLSWGMLAGAGAVAAETMIERALFPGLLDFTSDYRVTALFTSMHIGGGHIGAYVAMTLPFLLGIGLSVRRWHVVPVLCVVAVVTGYTLIVTFARTAYAAGLVSLLVATFMWLSLRRRTSNGPGRRWLAVLLIAPVLAGIIAAISSGFMCERFSQSASDLFVRESNWRSGWAVRDHDFLSAVFGMGLGTFPRIMLARGSGDRPSDFRLEDDRSLTISALTEIYIGQKISFPPSHRLRLTLRWRADREASSLGVSVCEKVLLYSENCHGVTIHPRGPGHWEDASADIPVPGLATKALFRRPVEFSLYSPVSGTTIAVRDLSLTDDQGWEVLVNGDFRDGMDRWTFTDDSHLGWRMKNLYLMLLFETGILGLVSFAALSALAIGGGIRALRRGEAAGAAVIGSVVSFLVSGLFDNVIEAPRLTTVFLLVAATGLILWEDVGPGELPEARGGVIGDSSPDAGAGAGVESL